MHSCDNGMRSYDIRMLSCNFILHSCDSSILSYNINMHSCYNCMHCCDICIHSCYICMLSCDICMHSCDICLLRCDMNMPNCGSYMLSCNISMYSCDKSHSCYIRNIFFINLDELLVLEFSNCVKNFVSFVCYSLPPRTLTQHKYNLTVTYLDGSVSPQTIALQNALSTQFPSYLASNLNLTLINDTSSPGNLTYSLTQAYTTRINGVFADKGWIPVGSMAVASAFANYYTNVKGESGKQ